MIRGTTPKIRFHLPFSVEAVTALYVTFVQNGVVKLEKTASDADMEGHRVTLMLTQTETLAFTEGDLRIQLRLLLTDGTALASRIVDTRVRPILKGGTIE